MFVRNYKKTYGILSICAKSIYFNFQRLEVLVTDFRGKVVYKRILPVVNNLVELNLKGNLIAGSYAIQFY